MATFRGKDGAVSFGTGLDVFVVSWTIETATDEFDVTRLVANTVTTGVKWKDFTFGCTEWSGSCEGFLDDTTAQTTTDLGTMLTGTFTDGDGTTRTGTAFCTGTSESNAATDLGRLTFSFRGSGAITRA